MKNLAISGQDVPTFLAAQDKGVLSQIGYGTPAMLKLPSQMGAIDELSSHESDEALEIMPPSCAPKGFLKFQASLSTQEK